MKVILSIFTLIVPLVVVAHDCPKWLEYESPPQEGVFDGKDPAVVAEANRRGLFNTRATIPTDGIISVYKHGKNGKAFIFRCHEADEGRVCFHYEMMPDYYEVIRDALLCEDAQNAK